MSIFSIVMLTCGQHIVKTVSIVIGCFATIAAVYIFSSLIQSISCILRIVLASIAGFVAILVTICLFCVGPVLIGGAAFGAGAHYIYTALPFDHIASPFTLMGESAYYYIFMCIAVILGCVVACFKKKTFMQICSSLIGGAGIATVVDVIFLKIGDPLSSFTFPIVMFTTGISGFLLQRCIHKWRRRKINHPPNKRVQYHSNDI
ncbi:MAG: hypothetical protein EB127_21035 [Alphaproteobacteria bacterium]|nr:hypothetical protein [Alphaproteobacteria bacterium]